MTDIPNFRDRVYACWMGKNIGGTLGGPLEGRMELLDIKGYTQNFVEAMENDDLDLQLVNLHCVEQYGGRADMRLLSREWLEHVHFQFDEYGHSLTNMRRGIGAPLSGHFNNFFTDCMGSPIRSEIWAILCAGMPDLAAYYAYHDASVDHAGGEGVYGEIFFAVLESLAFIENDAKKLIDSALSYLPEHSAVRLAVRHLLACHSQGISWQDARRSILDRFGTDNFTYAPVNIAFTLVGWLYEEGFTKQMLTTLNCGYDTDCTVATLGSLLGILYGTDYIDPYWTEPLGENIVVSRPITGFDAPKTISELTDRTLAARRLVQEHYAQQSDKSAYAIPYQCDVEVYHLPESSHKHFDLTATVSVGGGCPAFAPGETKLLELTLKNHQAVEKMYTVSVDVPGFNAPAEALLLPPMGEARAILPLTAPAEKAPLWQGRIKLSEHTNGVYWNSDFVPLTLLPTMDWRVAVDGETHMVYCPTNRLDVKGLVNSGVKSLRAMTTLSAAEDGKVALIFACKNPLKASLDGEVLFDAKDETVVIPAYHRAPREKCAEVFIKKGTHELTLEVGDPASFEELYFMPVDRRLYCAYRIDMMFV